MGFDLVVHAIRHEHDVGAALAALRERFDLVRRVLQRETDAGPAVEKRPDHREQPRAVALTQRTHDDGARVVHNGNLAPFVERHAREGHRGGFAPLTTPFVHGAAFVEREHQRTARRARRASEFVLHGFALHDAVVEDHFALGVYPIHVLARE